MMIEQEQIFSEISIFLKASRQKVLLIVAEEESSLSYRISEHLRLSAESFVHVDFTVKPDVEAMLSATPMGQSLIVLLSGFSNIKRLENIYIKYQLSRWSAKVITVCSSELLHPRLDPSLYFAPLVGKTLQKRLVVTIRVKSHSIIARPQQRDFFFKNTPADNKTNEYYQHLRQHFLNQRLMTNDVALMKFFASRVIENAIFKNLCFQFIYASRHDALVSIAAANAITLLKFAGISFAQMDLRNTCLVGANLENANLDHADLEGANLANVVLQQAWLRFANLRGTRLSNIILGENPHFPAADKVSSICFSPDGKWLISAENTKIVIWDVVAAQRHKVISGHSMEISTVDHHPFEPIIVSGGVDAAICIWNRDTGLLLHKISRKIFPDESRRNVVDHLCFSPDGMILASADCEVCLWDSSQFTLLAKLESPGKEVMAMQFDPAGLELICGYSDGNIYIWNIEQRNISATLQSNQAKICSIAMSPNSRWLAVGDHDNNLYLWDKSLGQLKSELKEHRDMVSALVFSEDSCYLASSGWDQTICIWEVESGQLKQVIKGHGSIIRSLRYQPAGNFLVSCSDDKTIRWWDIHQTAVSSVENINSELQRGWIRTVKVSPNNNVLASGCSMSNEITLRDVQTGSLRHIIRGHTLEVTALQFSLDGEWLVSGSFDNSVRWWNRKTGKHGRVFQLPGFVILDMQYRTNGELLVAGYIDKYVSLVEANSGQVIMHLRDFIPNFHRLYCSNNLDLYIFYSKDQLFLWDINQRCFYGSFKALGKSVTAMDVSPDGELLVLGGPFRGIDLWSIKHLNHLATLRGHEQEVNAIGFSTDGQLLASASWGDRIIIWDVTQRQILWKFKPPVAITSICFKDKNHFIVGCIDSSVQFWRRIENTNQWSLAWSSHALPLTFIGCNLNGAVDLAESAQQVMQQKGAIIANNDYAEEKPALMQRLSY